MTGAEAVELFFETCKIFASQNKRFVTRVKINADMAYDLLKAQEHSLCDVAERVLVEGRAKGPVGMEIIFTPDQRDNMIVE